MAASSSSSSSSEKRVDVLVFGATGFTGQRVARRIRDVLANGLATSGPDRIVTWAIAGRDAKRLNDLIKSLDLPASVPAPSVFVADVSDYAAVSAAIAPARVVISCVGPFRFFGEPVVKACVEFKADYVDITGEPEFAEKMYLSYHTSAEERGVAVVPFCGFDSIPGDMGTLFVKQEFFKRGFTASSVEMMIKIKTGPAGFRGNFTTYESAVHGVANAAMLRNIRKQVKRPALPILGPKLKLLGGAQFSRAFASWIVPFIGADASVVRMGQQITEVLRQRATAKPVHSLFPVQFAAYLGVSGLMSVVGLAIFGTALTFLTKYRWGKALLLRYPRILQLCKQSPSSIQIEQASFVSTFIGRGYKMLLPAAATTDSLAIVDPEYQIVAKVQGPEIGYVTTPICVVAGARKLLQDQRRKDRDVPSGVVTPAVAFASTDLVEVLNREGVTFSVAQERDL
ncbi:Saccharopine dehydrogenase-domain-containing protein [Zopfochytrium polystomum]|nr:Saccharopine dehydrogenase-domain-containing protein [Zopfochytrium polystomum]